MIGYLEIAQANRFLTEQELRAVVLAIFFHDAIYDARSSENEALSAELFQKFCVDTLQKSDDKCTCKISLPDSLQEATVKLILATASHDMTDDDNNRDDDNPYLSKKSMALFLDLDMAVLGKTSEAYLHYASLVRKEYHFVPHTVYCTKRAEILEYFLSKRIFQTKFFHQALEERARQNLQGEIALLRQQKIPGE